MPKQRLINARRVVVKLGSNVITAENSLNLALIESISNQISSLMDKGIEVILVSSGAMAAGLRKMGMDRRPEEIPKRQAISAIGQSGLMNAYEKSFKGCDKKVAQILLTAEDLNNRKRYLNARNTLNTLMKWKVVPIINENDTIMVEEIKLGDNDNLAAMITLLMDADFLFILTDIDGLYTKDPRIYPNAELIPKVTRFKKEIEDFASDIPGTLGTGGMLSKIQAAQKTTSAGIPMIVARGNIPNVLCHLFEGKEYGTYFVPKKEKMPSRKCWIAYTLAPKGSLVIDDGAVHAVMLNGKSLLAIGILSVEGDFEEGAAVSFKTTANEIIGIGLVNYRSLDINLIKGLKTSQIERCLGDKHYDEVIHRNNLALNDCCT
ncbi:MAG: glutamate 5-kinase [Desulfobacula sp.]|jgi:glutamate 5-kinase|uniref:glutamate 5-kinase n=1 Tax=Desulfobacula sp. TaxID=2593537 RepID=UPI001DB9B5E9|nr:glutamate 5-kinase [Desulfobacula sp.]MBT3485831.1 glutamate 5-kinase [Desulfobacula sp.]MBT3805712.1 glutamate 5-kinase [Desulfobacula sp.]MBT4025418.1 glutamate 5-kinase [Desulfobacula sp.]MBT4200044.1 glutamate 5-kinase [Desulfobacula sp.]